MLVVPSFFASSVSYVAPVEAPLDTPSAIETYIGTEAIEKGVDPVKAQSIAWAESRFRQDATNASSTASGVWQFLDGTFKDYCVTKYRLADGMGFKNDVKVQTECALRLLAEGGEKHWYPSKSHWKDYKPVIN